METNIMDYQRPVALYCSNTSIRRVEASERQLDRLSRALPGGEPNELPRYNGAEVRAHSGQGPGRARRTFPGTCTFDPT